MTPKRLQRHRTKGWRMPEGAVYVGRPTRWGNPFRVLPYSECHALGIGDPTWVMREYFDGRPNRTAASEAVSLFRRWATDALTFEMHNCSPHGVLKPVIAGFFGTYAGGRMPTTPIHARYAAPYAAEDVRCALRGHDLACWCPLDQPCHADVLLELANR